MMSIFILLRCV